jgi:hypothetical protein
VIFPLAVGIANHNRIRPAYRLITLLCGLWLLAEVYSFILRQTGSTNTHISFILTAFEILVFSFFYARVVARKNASIFFKRISIIGFVLVAIDIFVFRTPLNTFSLAIEYFLLTGFALYLFYEIIAGWTSREYVGINFVLLFYMLSSFPYFFIWEWLRIWDMELLRLLAFIHAVVHAVCYFIMSYVIWKSSLSYSVR